MKKTNFLDSEKVKHVHFIGIGGISMSGLAEILHNSGYTISGSDREESSITRKLSSYGIEISYQHKSENIKNPDLVVYTAAISKDNPELKKAIELGIPTLERAALLGEIMDKYQYSVAISGTHGKTTTTSMISSILLCAELNPTIHIGGELDSIGGSVKVGSKEIFVTEACEYVESFLYFHPYISIILNIELDHVDYYKDIEHVKQSFVKFISNTKENGYVVLNRDNENIADIEKYITSKIITFGINNENANYKATEIKFDNNGFASYKLFVKESLVEHIELSVPGIHNVYNSLAAIATCSILGASSNSIKQGLKNFRGAKKRFELKGTIKNNVKVYNDYAHHPTEVKVTLDAAKKGKHNKLYCVFQPHTYTRTKAFMNDFANALVTADKVIITDIYASREKDTGLVHSSKLAELINQKYPNKAVYIKEFSEITEYLKNVLADNDIVITMGAGDIGKVAEMLVSQEIPIT